MRSALFALFLSVAVTSLADDAYWSTVGGAGALSHSKDIRMVSEVVRISLGAHSMHVRASFNFKNDGNAQTVTMAFPEAIEDAKNRSRKEPFSITDFKSWVDGKTVPVHRKVLNPPPQNGTYAAVWLKQVSFGRLGTRHVVCEYDSGYGEGEGIIQTYYILRSGATWKGKIGDCKIYVDWDGLRDQGPPLFALTREPLYAYSRLHGAGLPKEPNRSDREVEDRKLSPIRRGGKSAMFEFKSFEPRDDISMSWPISFSYFRVNGIAPVGPLLDEGGDSIVKGPGKDPMIQLSGMVQLLGSRRDFSTANASDAPTHGFVIRKHFIEFPDKNHIRIDSKVLVLPRNLEPSATQGYSEGQWIYVNDLVAAFGGSYAYNPKTEMADIRIKW